MANNNNKEEPNTAPIPNRWYNLILGSTLTESSSSSSKSKFCTLRYEFKPASIDKKKPAVLHKNKENRVTVDFCNNQVGKPKVSFEGSSEDYKENDAVLFFDGEGFRLERLHRAVKRLRHLRMPGESGGGGGTVVGLAAADGVGGIGTGSGRKMQSDVKAIVNSVPVEMERIEVGEPDISGAKDANKDVHQNQSATQILSMDESMDEFKDLELHLDSISEDEYNDNTGKVTPTNLNAVAERGEFNGGMDVTASHNGHESDDEIADVDVSDDDSDKGPNAAEALRAQAQVNVGEGKGGDRSSSSSGTSGSGSSSESGSSSSDSDASDDSVTSI